MERQPGCTRSRHSTSTPKTGLGAQFDAIAIAIVDIESLLAIVPGLDLSGDHPSAMHVLMGRADIVP
jgi:hypothetical protein